MAKPHREDYFHVFDDLDRRLRDIELAITIGSPSFYIRLENDVVGAFLNGVPSKVPMDTTIEDTHGGVDLVNDQYTIPQTGFWLFDGGALQVATQVVGSTYTCELAGASGGAVLLRSLVASNTPRTVHSGRNWVRCTVGDRVYVRFMQNAGTGTNQDADGVVGSDFNYLRGVRLAI